ncbi:MAG TPA: hypothetical protein VMW66_06035 [Elusimicrobiales bacterium]|nr:hypothetical protein [Elusimicrobiales bacterium]
MKRSLSLLIAMLAVFTFSKAETIHLKDASIIKGSIFSNDSKYVGLKTPHGTLKIDKNEIVSIDGNVKVLYLKDGTVLKGTIKGLESETIEVNTKQGAVKVKQNDINYIQFSETETNLPIQTKKIKKPGKRKLMFSVHGEAFLLTTANNGLKKYLDGQVINSATYSINTMYEIGKSPAVGAKFAVIAEMGQQTQLGISAGYIHGFNSDIEILSDKGTQTEKTIERNVLRAMFEVKKYFTITKMLDISIGGGMGMAYIRQKSSDWNPSTPYFLSPMPSVTKNSQVFTWEASAAIVLKSKNSNTRTTFGVKYVGMPTVSAYRDTSGNILLPEMRWNSFGAFIGIDF